MRIILLGAPGSGKGTQGTRLAEHLGVPHVSSGDLLRVHVGEGTELGARVARYLDAGELVPDDLIVELIGPAVIAAAADAGGYVLDGFPRSLSQAELAYALAAPRGITADCAVYLTVPDDVARERLRGRATRQGRVDDADDAVIDRRLRVFHSETEPLLAFYRDRSILVTIDATKSPDEVFAAIVAALEALPST